MKRVTLNGRHILIAFRLVLGILLLFLSAYTHGEQADALIRSGKLYWLLAIAGVQFSSNLILAWVSDSLLRKGAGVAFFLMDLAVVTLAIFWTQGFESDLFLIYFLVIFMTAAARRPAISFAAAAVASVLYAFMFLKSGGAAELLQPSFLIRLPLLWVTAFFTSVLVETLEEEKKGIARGMEEQWDRSERLAALGQLARSVAQELNNPLTSILGMSQTLAPQSEEMSEDLKVIERNALRCKTIAADLERFAAGGPIELEPLDASRPMEEAVELLQDRIRRAGVRVKWRVGSDASGRLAMGSLPHLRQAFYNLILNAVQAMSGGGTLTLTVDKKSLMNDRSIEEDCVEVTVEDEGAGIPAEIKAALVDSRLDRALASPSGMGLVVAQNLIEKHRGKFGIENRAGGKGTMAWVRLPLSAAREGGMCHEIRMSRAA